MYATWTYEAKQLFVYVIDCRCDMNVSVAQWIARRTSNPEVVGSSPTGDDYYFFGVNRHRV